MATSDASKALVRQGTLSDLSTFVGKLFDEIDTNQDGVLSPEEISAALRGHGFSDTDIQEIIQEADKNGDGEIQRDEFEDGVAYLWLEEHGREEARQRGQANEEYLWEQEEAGWDSFANNLNWQRPTVQRQAGEWARARVFISSTFTDTFGEREMLVKSAIPEVKDVMRRKLHIIVNDLDLRWGVPRDTTGTDTLRICLSELDRCAGETAQAPFFVGILSERYGWVPNASDFPKDGPDNWKWMSGFSVTAHEILHGVLRRKNPNALFMMRNADFTEQDNYKRLSLKDRSAFQDFNWVGSAMTGHLNPVMCVKKEMLHSKIRAVYDECKIKDYTVKVLATKDLNGRAGIVPEEGVSKWVIQHLLTMMAEQFPAPDIGKQVGDGSAIYHTLFVDEKHSTFCGRSETLSTLHRMCDDCKGRMPVVVVGLPGAGKSALMAELSHQLKRKAGAEVIYHFVGVAPNSTDVQAMVRRICNEAGGRLKSQPDTAPLDWLSLCEEMNARLKQLASETPGSVYVVIDAVNQFHDQDLACLLQWLPQVHPNMTVVVSTLEERILSALLSHNPQPQKIFVSELSPAEQAEMLELVLVNQYKKHLDPSQREQLMAKRHAGLPLYLMVTFEELRVFGVFEKVSKKIQTMADDTAGMFEQVLQRLEREHGMGLVRDSLSLLAVSLEGLREDELRNLLGDEEEEALPAAKWAQLYRNIQFGLRPPGLGEGGSLSFFHQQFEFAVRRRYVNVKIAGEVAELGFHRRLANYFTDKAVEIEQNIVKHDELPRTLRLKSYHQRAAKIPLDVLVAVRVRPFIDREASSSNVVQMEGPTTIVKNPDNGQDESFTFDFSFDSFNPSAANFATQGVVYNMLAVEIIDNAFSGHPIAFFSYGQTGSGKTFTTFGTPDSPGLIPLVSSDIFGRIRSSEGFDIKYEVDFSMLEIYKSQINDLMDKGKKNLQIREAGDDVEVADLTNLRVKDEEEFAAAVEKGSGNRTVHATGMNQVSSRAHTLVSLKVRKLRRDNSGDWRTMHTGRVDIVDLAGSERERTRGDDKERQQEGFSINSALTVLNRCIQSMAKRSEGVLVPYRDSKMTQILKNAFVGNSKVIMLAAISPSSLNFPETRSTLKYASSAKASTHRVKKSSGGKVRTLQEQSIQYAESIESTFAAIRTVLDDSNLRVATEEFVAACLEVGNEDVSKLSSKVIKNMGKRMAPEISSAMFKAAAVLLANSTQEQAGRAALTAIGRNPLVNIMRAFPSTSKCEKAKGRLVECVNAWKAQGGYDKAATPLHKLIDWLIAVCDYGSARLQASGGLDVALNKLQTADFQPDSLVLDYAMLAHSLGTFKEAFPPVAGKAAAPTASKARGAPAGAGKPAAATGKATAASKDKPQVQRALHLSSNGSLQLQPATTGDLVLGLSAVALSTHSTVRVVADNAGADIAAAMIGCLEYLSGVLPRLECELVIEELNVKGMHADHLAALKPMLSECSSLRITDFHVYPSDDEKQAGLVLSQVLGELYALKEQEEHAGDEDRRISRFVSTLQGTIISNIQEARKELECFDEDVDTKRKRENHCFFTVQKKPNYKPNGEEWTFEQQTWEECSCKSMDEPSCIFASNLLQEQCFMLASMQKRAFSSIKTLWMVPEAGTQGAISDAGAAVLANLLSDNTSVEYINLSGNRLTDNGSSLLAAAVREKRTVKYVDLLGNEQMTTAGWNDLFTTLVLTDIASFDSRLDTAMARCNSYLKRMLLRHNAAITVWEAHERKTASVWPVAIKDKIPPKKEKNSNKNKFYGFIHTVGAILRDISSIPEFTIDDFGTDRNSLVAPLSLAEFASNSEEALVLVEYCKYDSHIESIKLSRVQSDAVRTLSNSLSSWFGTACKVRRVEFENCDLSFEACCTLANSYHRMEEKPELVIDGANVPLIGQDRVAYKPDDSFMFAAVLGQLLILSDLSSVQLHSSGSIRLDLEELRSDTATKLCIETCDEGHAVATVILSAAIHCSRLRQIHFHFHALSIEFGSIKSFAKKNNRDADKTDPRVFRVQEMFEPLSSLVAQTIASNHQLETISYGKEIAAPADSEDHVFCSVSAAKLRRKEIANVNIDDSSWITVLIFLKLANIYGGLQGFRLRIRERLTHCMLEMLTWWMQKIEIAGLGLYSPLNTKFKGLCENQEVENKLIDRLSQLRSITTLDISGLTVGKNNEGFLISSITKLPILKHLCIKNFGEKYTSERFVTLFSKKKQSVKIETLVLMQGTPPSDMMEAGIGECHTLILGSVPTNFRFMSGTNSIQNLYIGANRSFADVPKGWDTHISREHDASYAELLYDNSTLKRIAFGDNAKGSYSKLTQNDSNSFSNVGVAISKGLNSTKIIRHLDNPDAKACTGNYSVWNSRMQEWQPELTKNWVSDLISKVSDNWRGQLFSFKYGQAWRPCSQASADGTGQEEQTLMGHFRAQLKQAGELPEFERLLNTTTISLKGYTMGNCMLDTALCCGKMRAALYMIGPLGFEQDQFLVRSDFEELPQPSPEFGIMPVQWPFNPNEQSRSSSVETCDGSKLQWTTDGLVKSCGEDSEETEDDIKEQVHLWLSMNAIGVLKSEKNDKTRKFGFEQTRSIYAGFPYCKLFPGSLMSKIRSLGDSPNKVGWGFSSSEKIYLAIKPHFFFYSRLFFLCKLFSEVFFSDESYTQEMISYEKRANEEFNVTAIPVMAMLVACQGYGSGDDDDRYRAFWDYFHEECGMNLVSQNRMYDLMFGGVFNRWEKIEVEDESGVKQKKYHARPPK